MVTRQAVEQELIAEFFGEQKAASVFGPIREKIGNLIQQFNPKPESAQKFNEELLSTLVNIDVFLGNGEDERVKAALRQLEDDIETNLKMNLKVSASEKLTSNQRQEAANHFDTYKDRYEAKLQPQKDSGGGTQARSLYSKLLTKGLEKLEIQNGFAVTENGKVPVYVGRLSENAFIAASQAGKPFKDLVSPQHGWSV